MAFFFSSSLLGSAFTATSLASFSGGVATGGGLLDASPLSSAIVKVFEKLSEVVEVVIGGMQEVKSSQPGTRLELAKVSPLHVLARSRRSGGNETGRSTRNLFVLERRHQQKRRNTDER